MGWRTKRSQKSHGIGNGEDFIAGGGGLFQEEIGKRGLYSGQKARELNAFAISEF
jgi:hypothetical protein